MSVKKNYTPPLGSLYVKGNVFSLKKKFLPEPRKPVKPRNEKNARARSAQRVYPCIFCNGAA